MDLIKIGIIFGVIVFVIRSNKPLYIAMCSGIIAALIIYQVPFSLYPSIIKEGFIGRNTLIIMAAFYTITFLQRMLEKRGRLMLTEKSISKIFNSRRINATVIPFIIGMLPSVGAVLISWPIVVAAAGEYLDEDETVFLTSYYRHISEAFLPTYSSIILALQLTGVSMTRFFLAMMPLVLVLFLIGYFFYVRKIPKGGVDKLGQVNYRDEWINVLKGMWAIILTIIIILVFEIPVHYATIGVIILNIFVEKFTFAEIKTFFKSAFETKLIFTTIAVISFKEVLIQTGLIERLPEYFVHLTISPNIIYALLFFIGTVVVGSQAMIVTVLPIAFETLADTGLAYFTLLMSLSYIAMQISPTHVCLGVVVENAGTTFNGLIKKTMPVLITFVSIAVIYTFGLRYITG